MPETTNRQTPLHDLHINMGAKMVSFAGWDMPIHYKTGIMQEHTCCREQAVLFDVSHMAQVELRGDLVAERFESLVPSSIATLKEGKARYTFFTNEDGGIMDDLIVSNAGDHLFVVVNASMRDQDINHMRENLEGIEVIEIEDRALVAVQGPKAEAVVRSICPSVSQLKFMETEAMKILGVQCRVSRLGYTGEDGFEISIPNEAAPEITKVLLQHQDCSPAGLGARDSLRMEAGLCLYGNDIDTSTSPIEASLIWAIQKNRRENGGFPGATRIQREIADGVNRKLVGIKPEGRAPAREGVEIQSLTGEPIGSITSGGYGPTIAGPIAMGYVATEHSTVGDEVMLVVRGKQLPARITKLPFVKQNYKR